MCVYVDTVGLTTLISGGYLQLKAKHSVDMKVLRRERDSYKLQVDNLEWTKSAYDQLLDKRKDERKMRTKIKGFSFILYTIC